MTSTNCLRPEVKQLLHEGVVIPAHPLALNEERRLDVKRQKALTRYYIQSGAGGIAIGVHSTQFEIRDKRNNLYEPVLRLTAKIIDEECKHRPFIKIAGICGATGQAISEAQFSKELGYDIGLVSLGGLDDWSELKLIKHVEQIAEIIPIFGFYLQRSVGGRYLSFDFWRQFSEIPNVAAIKIAPFNRYQTLDVVRAVCESSRASEIALYTGNDDNIVGDLLTTYRFKVGEKYIEKKIVGGLLGHWAVWTKKAVALLEEIKQVRQSGFIPMALLKKGNEITDTNAAFFDPAHQFAGCIPGIHEVLRRQGLLGGRWCLNPGEDLSPGQFNEINRVYAAYPHLNDDDFVAKHLKNWLT